MGISRATTLFLLSAICLLQFLKCSGKEQAGPPNIVLITIDGLRADYLTPDHMPSLYDFAKARCAVYENARANSTWNTPSHVTMLTGLLQSEHGVESEGDTIPPKAIMIQERLRQSGYATLAFVCEDGLPAKQGLDKGFDKLHRVIKSPAQQGPESETFGDRLGGRMASLDAAEQHLLSHPAQPLFLFVQTRAVQDYWYRSFPQDKDISEMIEEIRQEEELSDVDHPLWEKFKEESSSDRKRHLYIKAVRDLDKRIGEFLALLQDSSIFANTKIIITSGHGEGLGDAHGDYVSYGHGGSPYSDLVDVPLVVYGIRKKKTGRLVGLDDIAGTILEFAGLAQDPPKSLFKQRKTVVSEYFFSREDESTGRSVAIMSEKRKFLISTDGKLHMFEDPLDKTDLILTQYTELAKEDISDGLREQLNALGYLQ